MLIEIKVKVTRLINNKKRKSLETYLIEKEFFAEAEYAITDFLNNQINEGNVKTFDILSLRLTPIKEVATQYGGTSSFIATLKDIFHDNEGNEKAIKYKVLLWANDLSSATSRVRELQREGYDMLIEGLKEVNYTYLNNEEQQ